MITSASIPPVLGEVPLPQAQGRGFQDYNSFVCDGCGYGFGVDDNLNIVERQANTETLAYPCRLLADAEEAANGQD